MESAGVTLSDQSCTQKQEPVKDVPFFRRKRYLVTILTFLGMVLQCFLIMNLNIVIVDMTSKKTVHDGNQTYIREAEFKWTSFEKGFLLGCESVLQFFSFLGGLLSCRFGGVRVFGLAIFIGGVLNCLTPFLVHLGVPVLVILRMIGGLCCGISFVSLLQIFVRWSPTTEKFRLIDYAASGFLFGVIAVFPVCGVILEKWSWPWVFFLSGGISIMWYMIWILLIYNDPLEDKFISLDEQKFINENVHVAKTKTKRQPWLKILSSKAVWAFLNEKFVEAWSFSFTSACLPIYINDAFNASISRVGLIASIPAVCNLLGVIVGANIADFLFNRIAISRSKIYIGYITICHICCIILLLMTGLLVDFTGSIICMCILRLVFGGVKSVYSVLPLDIGGEYASLVAGFGASAFTIALTLNPILMTYMVPNHDLSGWSRYFLMLSAFNVWGAIVFYFCGSAEPQPWSSAQKKKSTQNKLQNLKSKV